MGDDLVKLFYKWKAEAVANDGGLPYFATDGWKGATKRRPKTAGEVARQEKFAVRDDREVGMHSKYLKVVHFRILAVTLVIRNLKGTGRWRLAESCCLQ